MVIWSKFINFILLFFCNYNQNILCSKYTSLDTHQSNPLTKTLVKLTLTKKYLLIKIILIGAKSLFLIDEKIDDKSTILLIFINYPFFLF